MPRRAKSVVLAMDIGSSSLRTALFTDEGARILASTAACQYSVRYNAEGGAELEPRDLLHAANVCLTKTVRAGEQLRLPIVAVAGSALWHSLLGLNRRGEPITPIFTWADSRSASDAAELRKKLREREIQLRTGCMLRAPYWPAKLRWLRRTERALFQRTARWISPGAWIFEKIFGARITSYSMASGTGFYNLKTRDWDAELCDLSGVRVEQLGILRDHCLTSGSSARGLRKVIICAALGDGAAGNLGSGADDEKRIAINIGTSAAIRRIKLADKNSAAELPPGLFRYVVDERRFLVGGAISNAGNLRQWCLRELRLSEKTAEQALARVTAADDALTVLPFWGSERAPTWPEQLRGVISGFTPTTTAAEILRAATTSTFYRLVDILEKLAPDSREVEIIVSGGILHSKHALEILADCFGHNIRVCPELESSLRGAAVHALEEIGCEVKPLPVGRVIRQRPALAQKHRQRRAAQNSFERKFQSSS